MEEHKEKSGTECRENVIRLIERVAQMTEVAGATFREASEALARLIIENPNESKAVLQCDDKLREHYIDALLNRNGAIISSWLDVVRYWAAKEEKSLLTDEKLDNHPTERCQDIGMFFEKIRKT